jgi:hypothetical protein
MPCKLEYLFFIENGQNVLLKLIIALSYNRILTWILYLKISL